MILQFEEPFSHDDETLGHLREPEHQEAVRALLAGNHQLFLKILSNNQQGRFNHSPHKVVAESLDLQENKARAEFDTLFNTKLSNLLMQSQEGIRFFETTSQISLHNYIKQVYFEDKKKMKPEQRILNAYKDIFKRIVHIDDLVFFVEFIVNLFLREAFDFVQTQCRAILASNGENDNDLEILKYESNFNDEEKLIIKYCFCVVVQHLGKKAITDSIVSEVKNALQNHPYKRLANACLKIDPFTFLDLILCLHKHPRQFIEYDFKNNECRLNCQNLHPQLRCHQLFSSFFLKLNYLQQSVEKYEIIAHSARLEDNKILLGLNYYLLSQQFENEYSYTLKVSNKTISEFIDYLNLLVNHITYDFVAIRQEKQINSHYNIMYVCKSFEMFVNLNKLRSIRSESYVIEHLLIMWARLFTKWMQIETLKNEPYLVKALSAYFSLFSSIQREEELPSLGSFQSDLSKTIFELLLKLEKYPTASDCFRGIKAIIFKWSLQIIPDTQELKTIISKFMVCFFSDELVLKAYSKEDIFETPAICKIVKKYINEEFKDYISKRYQQLENDKITSSAHPLAKKHANFFPKLGYIISSKIIGEASQEFASTMMKCYLNYAHVWPILHSFRMWILQVCKDSIDTKFQEKLEPLKELADKLFRQIMSEGEHSMDGWMNLSRDTVQLYNQFQYAANCNISCLRMKRNKDNLSRQNCAKYFEFMLNLQEINNKLKVIPEEENSALREWLSHDFSIQSGLKSIVREFKMTFRCWLCNSNRFLTIQEEQSIMNCIAKLIIQIVQKPLENDTRWSFICDILGLNQIKYKSTLNSRQIMGTLQKYTAKLSNKLQEYIPFNFAVALYSTIKPKYKKILKYLLTELLRAQDGQQLWQIVEVLMVPSVLISGPCIINGQSQEKTKEDMAFGLFYDQFEKITELLTDASSLTQNMKIVINLEKKKKLFSKFYEILKAKNTKIVERLRSHPPENRFRGRQMQVEDVIQALSQMGVSREEAEIALEHIEYPDHNLAMDWIDSNQERIQQIIVARTLERTRHDVFKRQSRKESEVADHLLPTLSYQGFYDENKLIKLSKSWIKVIYKQIFKEENQSSSEVLKNILFMYMDSLKPDKSQIQYYNLSEKIFQDIDEMNKLQDITTRIGLRASILEGTFSKSDKTKTNFYGNSVNLKLLTYLPKIKSEESLAKVFSLLNATLPAFSSKDQISPALEVYLAYLLDNILQFKTSHKSQCEIMLKIAKTGKEALMQRITRNLTIFSKENLIKQSIFSLMNMILESDKELSEVNAELDLKTFLYERYKHRIASFDPDKEHVLEIDIKEYSSSFQKYDKGSAIYEVSKQMLSKKKNKNKLLFYDCRQEKNQFDYSHFGKCSFISYPIKQHFKTMIRSLLSSLFEAEKVETQDQMLTDLHKLLFNFRILLPFAVHEQVGGKNLIDWLLFSSNHSRKKFKFLTFLTLNVNLFVKREGYNFISLSDYICARIIKSTINSSENLAWTAFNALYLCQVRKFSEYSSACFSKENDMTLIKFFEQVITKAQPLEYLPISQFLYIQYKRRLLDNLKRKYKFVGSQHEPTFQRQFLNVSPFFNSINIKKKQRNERTLSDMIDILPEQLDDDDDDSAELIIQQERHRILQRRQIQSTAQVQQIIVPLPIPQPKQNEGKQQQSEMKEEEHKKLQPIVLYTCELLDVIIEEVEKYLSFQQQIDSKFDLKEVSLPQGPIDIPNITHFTFKLKVQEAYVDIDIKVKKIAGFEKRISEIYSILEPKLDWEIKKESTQDRQAFASLGRRLIQSLSNPMAENNRETLMTLQRLIHGRYHRAGDQGAINPPVRNININDIYQHLQEFTEPIIPVVPPPQPQSQSMQIEAPIPLQVQNQAAIAEQPQQAPVSQVQNIIQPQEVSQDQPIHPPQPEIVIEENLHAMEEQKPEGFYQPLPQVPVEGQQIPSVGPLIEIETILDNRPQQQVLIREELGNNQQLLEANIDPIPVSNVESNPPAAQEQPPRQREILTIFGLPQTFLRDVGLDEELFDSLPEDLQQQQLMTFMGQQGVNLNRGGQNRPNQPNQPNQPQDLQSENIAFIQSLDPQTRAQVLLEATPEFLASLPPNLRDEADRYRSLQINRMIEEQQIEEERNYLNNKKPKVPQVYPKVYKQQFSTMPDQAASQIFRGVFNLYPKIRLSALKILLQNKNTQEKALASIIALIYSFEENYQQARKRPINKIELANKEIKINSIQKWTVQEMSQIRTNLLHIVLEHLKIPLYKDEEFLIEKIKPSVYLSELEHCVKDKQFLDPIIELSAFALCYYPDLATELLKKTKDLPDQLFKKIVEGIRKQQWPSDFYESLSNFGDNEKLKEIFCQEFQAKPPKIEILGKLLKYKFAHISSLRKIHQDALQYYSTSYHQFLNQIFSIYTVESLNEIEPLLLKHKQIHFEVIKYLYQLGRELDKEPIGLILKKPHLLDFETKKFIFRNHPKLRRQTGRRVHIEVDRAHLFQGSYNQLMSRSLRELQGKIQVSFINEPGYDAGGLKREWFLLVSRQIFNQDYALFQKSSSGSTYQPNPKSYVNPDHLNYFKFIGRFIGKALVERQLIDAYFTRAFYKMILGQQLQFKDLQAQDYEFYKSMQWLKNNNIDENTFTFSYIYDNFGNKVEKELVPGGKQIVVNEDNKLDYIEKYCMSKMRDDFATQISKFLEGFHQIVPQECISFFEAKELELLISGVPEVDIEDLKRNTDYSGYNPTDQIIVWFWEVVSEYSQEDLAKLVQFITGTSKIPVEGFSHMIGMNGIQRISIHRDPCQHQLPKSHTCFNQLDLPNYHSKQILKQKLGICLAWGSEGFGFM